MEREIVFDEIKKIVSDNYGVILTSENSKINSFCSMDIDAINFELLLEKQFGSVFDLKDNPKISKILDQICQF